VSRQLAGAVGWGGWSCTSAATRGQRALLRSFDSTGEEKRAVPWPLGAVPEGLAEMAGLCRYAACSRWARRSKDAFEPSMNTEPFGHVRRYLMAQVTSDAAISTHLPFCLLIAHYPDPTGRALRKK
jgi:hypothetical protein